MEDDLTYYTRRAFEERRAALDAGHPGARQAHRDLAERYEDFVRSIAANAPELAGHLVDIEHD
jgi:hypothetical protein